MAQADDNLVGDFQRSYERISQQIKSVIVGHEQVIHETLTCLLAGGHALLEGVPGLGKTLLVRTLGEALDLSFGRIQFTPDLMPADITGTNIVEADAKGSREFRFQNGPIFANLILADEINRATPKTQSAVLEAMQEQTVTVARTTHKLPSPFFVLATQNPLEMEGTYPLPEAQLDRFMFKILVRTPGLDELCKILDRTTGEQSPRAAKAADAATWWGRLKDRFGTLEFWWRDRVMGYDNQSRNRLWQQLREALAQCRDALRSAWDSLGASVEDFLLHGRMDAVLWVLIGTVAAAALAVETALAARLMRRVARERQRSRDPLMIAERRMEFIRRLFQRIDRAGPKAQSDWTLRRMAREAADRRGLNEGDLRLLVELHNGLRWGRRLPAEEELARAEQAAQRLTEQLARRDSGFAIQGINHQDTKTRR